MTWSRGITEVTLSPDASQVTVTGDSNKDDTVDDGRVVQLHIALTPFPDGGEIISAPVHLGLKTPWSAVFEDVKPPFDQPDQEVFIVGMVWLKDPIEHFVWQQRKPIEQITPSGSDVVASG